MKTNVTNRAFKLSILILAIFQMRCGYDVCQPDRLNRESSTTTKLFNGTSVNEEFYSASFGILFDYLPSGKVREVSISDGSVTSIDEVDFDMRWVNEETSIASVKNIPVVKDQEKTSNLNVDINADYYTVENISNSNKSALPPTSKKLEYTGWSDDYVARIQFGIYGEDYTGLLGNNVITVSDVNDVTLEFGADEFLKQEPVTSFPNTSPLADLKMTRERTTKTWTGTTKIKVLKNSESVYRVLTTIQLTNDSNILSQATETSYRITPAQCTHYDGGPS